LLRTQFAAQAVSFAETFKRAVKDFPVGQHRAEMTAPEGSTGGGVQALQHIRLVPPEGAGHSYVVGNANPAEKTAELRSLAYVDGVSVARFGAPSGLDPQAYAAFIDRAGKFLEMLNFRVVQATQPPAPPRPPQAIAPRSRLPVVVLVVWSVALLAVGVLFGIMALHRGWFR
jgi:hypothetical protein